MFKKRIGQEYELKQVMQEYCSAHGNGTQFIIHQKETDDADNDNEISDTELSLNLTEEYSIREAANYLGEDAEQVQKLIDSGKLTCVSDGMVYGASIASRISKRNDGYHLLHQLNVCGEKTQMYSDDAINSAIIRAEQQLAVAKEDKTPLQAISLEIDVDTYKYIPPQVSNQILNYAIRLLNVQITNQECNPAVKALERMNYILKEYIKTKHIRLKSLPENLPASLLDVVQKEFSRFSKQSVIGLEDIALLQSKLNKTYLSYLRN